MTPQPTAPDRVRILELQADRALQGLDDIQANELTELLSHHSDLDNDEMDLAAAALDAAWSRSALDVPLSAGLRDRLVSSLGEGTFAPAGMRSLPSRRDSLDADVAAKDVANSRSGPTPASRTILRSLVWVAAAAGVVWVAMALDGLSGLSREDHRERLIASAPDLIRVDWQATEDPSSVGLSGDLVWSNEAQQGYMLFRGLARNDASKEQYQLWIFDRGQAHPVDGGVFDSEGPDVLVPIDAKLNVLEPWQFAVTVEKPGGVVVSSKERIVALAALRPKLSR